MTVEDLEALLDELGELELLLEALERGRVIPCPRCGRGRVCVRCRSREDARRTRFEVLELVAHYARARLDHAPAAALESRPRGARDDAR